MSDETRKVLDLDDLFGQARAVKVRWKGQEYELLRMEALTPIKAQQFGKLQDKARSLQTEDEIDEERSQKIESLFDEMLRSLCSDLPLENIPFMGKMRIITFYIEETQGKKVLEAALRSLTGETSSPG